MIRLERAPRHHSRRRRFPLLLQFAPLPIAEVLLLPGALRRQPRRL
jgi:hypothetical protein